VCVRETWLQIVAQRSRTVYSFTIQPPLRYFPIYRGWVSFPYHIQAHVPDVLDPNSDLSIQYPGILKRPLWDQYPVHIPSHVDTNGTRLLSQPPPDSVCSCDWARCQLHSHYTTTPDPARGERKFLELWFSTSQGYLPA
jgi:hypothetical protein